MGNDWRRAMTPARKRRIWERDGGVCWLCRDVDRPVPMFGPLVRYDHRTPGWFTERDLDEDVSPAHVECDRPKTAADQKRIAKTKRQKAKNDGTWRKSKRPVGGRGFSKTLTRGFDGKVRPK